MISGEIQIQFTIEDPINPAASPREVLQRLLALTIASPYDDADDDSEINKLDSHDADEDEETSDETDDPSKPEVVEKRKKKLRLARLKRKTKARAYEFTGGRDVVGIAFVEISRITDLPPERNSGFFGKENVKDL